MNTHSALTKTTSKESPILCINLNQDHGCFAVGLENGFKVYNTDPMDLRVKRLFANTTSTGQKSGTGIGLVRMLHRTNYLALVGGGKNPKFANNKLIIWDDLKRKSSLSLDFMSPILNVLLSRIRIIVVLRNQVQVFGFSAPPKNFAIYETIDNEYGLADLSVNSHQPPISYPPEDTFSAASSIASAASSNERSKFQILAFPGRSIGQIQVVDVSPHGQEKNLVSIIKAHKSKIRCLALNRTGKMIASASETGTIIRIHSTHNTALLFEFRRGLDRAIITSMTFSHDDSKLAVLSDKNTLHIFNISLASESITISSERASPTPTPSPPNRKHLLKKLSLPIPIPEYFNSTWSFSSININQYHAKEEDSDDIGTVGWSGNDSVVVIWKKKRIWEKYQIREKKGSRITTSESHQNSHWEISRTSWKSLDDTLN